ncbi:MAG: hypothetical protein CVU59_01020 [Deltaproteobacteria bacterium HGW-Deltaproteobacteria-17]|nr:MAG: hypothetical protein CVU59_01020 [Deltaproteobacteria bacterium HGW-Deltaproteobacteria-17]
MSDSENSGPGTPAPRSGAAVPWRELALAWRDAGLLVVFATVSALAFNGLRPNGLPLLRYAPFDLLGPCPEILNDVPRITADKLKPGDPNVVIVDVRLAWDFLAGHIPGAWFLPLYETAPPDEAVVQRLRALKPGTWIVLVGAAGTVTAERALTALSVQGLRGLFVLEGGLGAWEGHHGPLAAVQVPAVADPQDPEGALWIDARDEESFAAGHREGAINLPFDDLLPPDPEVLLRIRAAKADRIYVYPVDPASGADRAVSGATPQPAFGVACELVARGFRGVMVWNAPYPGSTGPDVRGSTPP